MFKNIALSIFVMLPFTQLGAQVSFNSSSEVVTFLEGEWCPKITCGGFVSSPCQPLPESYHNHRYEFSSVPNSSDSIHMSVYINDSLQFDETAYVSFSTNSGEKWNLDYGWYKYNIETQHMSTNDSLALEIDGSDTSTIIYSRNNSSTSLEDRVANEKIPVSPNPVENILSIDFKSGALIDEVTILDANGRIASTFFNTNSNVDVSNLKSGMYFLKFTEGNKTYYSNFIKI